MSTYLTHGGADRERALVALWTVLEKRVERQERVSIADLRPGLATRRQGWHEDTQSLVHAFSGHAYHRVILAVEQIARELDHGLAGHDPRCDFLELPSDKLRELRLAYGLLEASRQLADELGRQEALSDRFGRGTRQEPA